MTVENKLTTIPIKLGDNIIMTHRHGTFKGKVTKIARCDSPLQDAENCKNCIKQAIRIDDTPSESTRAWCLSWGWITDIRWGDMLKEITINKVGEI